MPMFTESYREFAKRNGDDAVKVEGRLIFSNGAQADANEGLQRFEAPDDLHERLGLQRKRMKELLRKTETEFQRTQASLIEMASMAKAYSHLPDAPADGKEALLKLKAEVSENRKTLERIETELSQTPQGIESKVRADDRAAHAQSTARVISELASIRLD